MKHVVLCGLLGLSSLMVSAQGSYTATFQEIEIGADTFRNGSDSVNYFVSEELGFTANYDTASDFWASGFAMSTVLDTIDGTFSNLYGVYAPYEPTNTYAVANLGEGPIEVVVPGFPLDATGIQWMSMEVANTTYPFKSMRDGDAFAKKFGGASGDDPDYFFIRISSNNDSLDFYLADFRFEDSADDYILEDWTTIDLSGLELGFDNLEFELFSSDTGQFGINTPLFFALDNISYSIILGENDIDATKAPKVWSDGEHLHLNSDEPCHINVWDISGRLMFQDRSFKGQLIPIAASDQIMIIQTIVDGKPSYKKVLH